ncbi:hypothetical protein KY321_02985 [Candidatus Woesearchaeota archaeon]|nr:hypothetical protein [Candidatus Woesearchaeota archaeon]
MNVKYGKFSFVFPLDEILTRVSKHVKKDMNFIDRFGSYKTSKQMQVLGFDKDLENKVLEFNRTCPDNILSGICIRYNLCSEMAPRELFYSQANSLRFKIEKTDDLLKFYPVIIPKGGAYAKLGYETAIRTRVVGKMEIGFLYLKPRFNTGIFSLSEDKIVKEEDPQNDTSLCVTNLTRVANPEWKKYNFRDASSEIRKRVDVSIWR